MAGTSRQLELEAQLRANPDDVTTHHVYADYLQSIGDPHGELAAIQLALETESTPKLARHEAAWLARHSKLPKGYAATWRRGFVRSLEVRMPRIRDVIADIIRRPALRFVESVHLYGGIERESLDEIVSALPHLHELVVHTQRHIGDDFVATVTRELTELRRLELRGHLSDLPAITSRSLASLALAGVALKIDGDLPALRELVLHGSIDVGTRTQVLDGRWPLILLGMFDDDVPVERIIGSRVFAGLEAVGGPLVDNPPATLASLGKRQLVIDPFATGPELYALGQTLRDLERFSEAFRCFDIGVAIDPRHSDMWLERGNLLRDLGRQTEALPDFERAARLAPKQARAHYNVAGYYREVRDPLPGLEAIKKACDAEPDDPAAWHMRGQLEQMAGKTGKLSLRRAAKLYREGIADDADPADDYFQLACVHILLGERAKGLEALRNAIALDPVFKNHAWSDVDLVSLHDDPQFRLLVGDRSGNAMAKPSSPRYRYERS
jgi:uncharacterized protein (TIGR02996 family)